MSDDEDEWSIDDLRTNYESDEHWLLRREFLIRNKGRFTKLRLLSLSQVFCNMEFLGCKYPDETMALVAELSQGIVEEYRSKQSGRLQRTFVKASTAAEAKSKGKSTYVRNVVPAGKSHRDTFSVVVTNSAWNPNMKRYNLSRENPSHESSERTDLPYSLRYSFNPNDLNGLVLVEQLYLPKDPPLQLIHRSCQMSGKDYGFTFLNEDKILCTFELGNIKTSGCGLTKETAKQAAAESAIKELKKVCHTIQIKAHALDSNSISLHEVKGNSDTTPKFDENNVGCKLLRLMGWSGGALGKNDNGLHSPIDLSKMNTVGRTRLGLGCTYPNGQPSFTPEDIENFLTKEFQKQSKLNRDLVFSSEFSKSEREIIHKVAHRLHLKSKSYGKGTCRCLVISKKTTLPCLLQQIIDEGETEKYRVIFPQKC